jgi:F0F1-type ATP synthase assembly protein I
VDWVQPWMLTMALVCAAAFLLGYIFGWFLDGNA